MMRIRTRYRLFQAVMVVGALVFLLSLYDMFLNESAWQAQVFLAYLVLLVLALLLYVGHKPHLDEEIAAEELRAVPEGEPLPAYPSVEEQVTATEVEEVPKPRRVVADPDRSMAGGHNFKCPFCSNVFGLEATHVERQRDFRMACPYCQNSIRIPKRPKVAPGNVQRLYTAPPTERVLFSCGNCGEVLRFTAPGSRLDRALRVTTCPNCNSRQVMQAASA